MRIIIAIATLFGLLAVNGSVFADAPLKSALGLDTEQAKQVRTIQKEYRAKFRSTRQVFNRESRALRRARSENDAARTAELENVTEGLKEKLRAIRSSEQAAIRGVLTAEQDEKFAALLAEQRASPGSSRDDRIHDN